MRRGRNKVSRRGIEGCEWGKRRRGQAFMSSGKEGRKTGRKERIKEGRKETREEGRKEVEGRNKGWKEEDTERREGRKDPLKQETKP